MPIIVAPDPLNCVALGSGDVPRGGGLRNVGRTVVSPFAWTLNQIAHPIADIFGGAVNYSSVTQQNQQLREELAVRSLQSNETVALQNELEQISSMLHLTFVGSLDSVVAQVTTNSPTNFSATFTIAKGELDGVLTGMPVVGSGGLLGRVVASSGHSAVVDLISDQNSIVGCTFGSSRANVLLYGRGVNASITATAVPLNSPLSPGALCTTSGLRGGIFPPGLPVARAQTVTLTPGGSTYNLVMTPTADLHNLNYVSVLLWEPST
jgi:rod shape-determining protein MreC